MKILFDKSGRPLSQKKIKSELDKFGKSYKATMNNITQRIQQGLTQKIFSETFHSLWQISK